jgi:small GTP-binding protein
MDQNSNVSVKLNIFFLGDSKVGKTSFLTKYVNNSFKEDNLSTIGIDFVIKKIELENGKEITLKFFDTAGQENYRALSFNLLKSADGIFLMYDITNIKTFDEINTWIKNIKDIKEDNFPIVLIGNKCDLQEERIVDKEEGQKLAQKNGFPFLETSCKEGTNIEEAIKILISKILEKKNAESPKENEEGKTGNNNNGKKDQSFQLSKGKKNQKKKKCCK